MDAFTQKKMSKKQIELYAWVLGKLYTKQVEIEYNNEIELGDLANQKATEFYNDLTKPEFDYGWQEIYD